MDPRITAALITALAAILAAIITAYRVQIRRRLPDWLAGHPNPTWTDALEAAGSVLRKVQSTWNPSLVIGLGRSGGLWGGWLAGNLGTLPFAVIDISYRDTGNGRVLEFPGGTDMAKAIMGNKGSGVRVLVVLGAASTGTTFREFRRQVGPEFGGCEVRCAALFKNAAVTDRLDFYGTELDRWPTAFPWHVSDSWRTHLRLGPRREENVV